MVPGGDEEIDQHQQHQRTKESSSSLSSSSSLFYRYKVTTGRLSSKTKVAYAYHINEFLSYYKITDLVPLKEYSPKVIKQMVKDYVLYLRDVRKLSRKSISLHVSALAHFFYTERDDEYNMDWKKVRDEIPPDENETLYYYPSQAEPSSRTSIFDTKDLFPTKAQT